MHNPVWYAAYTRSRAEKKVAEHLQALGIDHYLPLVATLRQWSDRKKKVMVPLIRSYIFVHITRKEHLAVLEIPGIVKILHFGGKPVPIPDWQILNLKILLGTDTPVSEGTRRYAKGEAVHITQGSLQGLRGHIVWVRRRHQLVISVSALDYNMTIDINPAFVDRIQENDGL
jgi:transcription antitermination factor NusG